MHRWLTGLAAVIAASALIGTAQAWWSPGTTSWLALVVAALLCTLALLPKTPRFVSLWGFTWSRDEYCRHFLITGATGTGKTTRALIPLLLATRTQQQNTGILAIDSKGVMWEPLERICRSLGQTSDLRLIQVRPPHSSGDWTPPLRLNLLADRHVPWTTYAKLIVDTATAAGQRGGQAFFKESARDAIAHGMQGLADAGEHVTLENVHNVLCQSADMQWLVQELRKRRSAEADYFADLTAQPPEQRAGTLSTVANFLRSYTVPAIADVFCSIEPNFSLREVDHGKVICLSVPQLYQVERRYLNLLCKQLFLLHAFRRFDLPSPVRMTRNVIVLVLDEGQKTTLVSEDGFADHGSVDELREAGVCIMSATQTPLSFYASFETEKKADVFMANHQTQIHFRAADEKGAKILSQRLGGRRIRKYSGSVGGGRTSRSWQETIEPWFSAEDLLALPPGVSVVTHPHRLRPRRMKLAIPSSLRR